MLWAMIQCHVIYFAVKSFRPWPSGALSGWLPCSSGITNCCSSSTCLLAPTVICSSHVVYSLPPPPPALESTTSPRSPGAFSWIFRNQDLALGCSLFLGCLFSLLGPLGRQRSGIMMCVYVSPRIRTSVTVSTYAFASM